jgi:uncharacterized protein
MHRTLRTEVVIVGGGLAGIVTALELLERGRRVLILDRDHPERFGGLARESFGGFFLVDTPQQRRAGIRDSGERALQDWLSYAEFGADEVWPRRWAALYVHECTPMVQHWLREKGIGFFPLVQWMERGLDRPGNSVPRFHMVWGTGHRLVEVLLERLRRHRHADRLELRFRQRVTEVLHEGGRAVGVGAVDEESGAELVVRAERVVLASGGICGGDLSRLRKHWCGAWGTPPARILNGSHRYADGAMHDAAAALGGAVTHLDRQWNYAAGVHHPDADGMAGKGLSLVPPRSALWVNARGERIGPRPQVSGYDTRHLVEQICQQPEKYSWQVMNQRIAVRELAVSGAALNDALRERRVLGVARGVVFGNRALVRTLLERCPDFVSAGTLEELVARMNALAGNSDIDPARLRAEVERWDALVRAPDGAEHDEQLRLVRRLREYRGDRMRTCARQPILDPGAGPLIAVREFILSRKSLGGIRTDLDCRVLRDTAGGDQEAIPGLYAVGEAAGFGGGGMHGHRALEGGFLGSCVLGGRRAAMSIAAG